MEQQKGYSLIEVLISLILVSTVALTLLEQQLQTKHILNQLIVRTENTQLLDSVDEHLYVSKLIPHSLQLNHFNIKKRYYGQIKWK